MKTADKFCLTKHSYNAFLFDYLYIVFTLDPNRLLMSQENQKFGYNMPSGGWICPCLWMVDFIRASSLDTGPPPPEDATAFSFGRNSCIKIWSIFRNCILYSLYKACPVTSKRSNTIVAVTSGRGCMFITLDNHIQACSIPNGCTLCLRGGKETMMEAYNRIIPDILFRNLSCFSTFPSLSYL